jgi:hypothetical protein
MKRDDLLDLVYRFHPRGMKPGEPGYKDTEEGFRQIEAVRRAVDDHPRWKAMMRRLSDRYPIRDWSIYLFDGVFGAYSGLVYIPGHWIGFHVSLLGPYYGIHRLGGIGEEEAALDIAREIEATYLGYEEIPPELGEEVVPDVVAGRNFGESTIYDCLLSPAFGSSRPDDVEPRTKQVPYDPDADGEPNIHYHDVRH